MNTFLQFFTEGRGPKLTQEIQDKIVAYKKENPGASFENIGKIFNTPYSTIYKIMSKNWPEWKKFSTTKTGSKAKYTQEIQDKMVAYKKENPGASFENIGKIFNASSNLVFKIISKNWPEWKKYSTVVRGMPPINQELHDKVVEYKKENPSKTLREISKVFNISHSGIKKILNKNWPDWQKSSTTKTGPKAKYTQEIQDKVVEYKKENPSKGILQIAKIFNINYNTILNILNRNWPGWQKYSTAKSGRRLGSSVGSNIKSNNNIKPKAFTDIQSELDYYKSLIIKLEKEIEDKKAKGEDTSVGKIAAEFNVPREVVHIAKHGADKNTNDSKKLKSDNPNYSNLYGKLVNRREEFNYIEKLVNKMGPELTILSLPHTYDFEKTFAEKFNKKLTVYGTMYKGNKYLADTANKLNADPGSNIKAYTTNKDINNIVMDPENRMGSYFSKNPNKSGWFHDNQVFLPEVIDIIDLDYKGIPGTIAKQKGAPPMRLDESHNPFLYPAKAAKMLKPGGLLFVTYLLRGQQNMRFSRTTAYKTLDKFGINQSDNEVGNKLSSINNSKDWVYFQKDKPPIQTQESLVTKNAGEYTFRLDTYNSFYQDANLYTAGILKCAISEGVKIEAVYTNMYSGAQPCVMYRGVFLKQ